MSEEVICPWCLTEIVWDPEFGPESHCPHCDNELNNYRTIELGGASQEEDEAEETIVSDWDDYEDEEEGDDPKHKHWLAQGEGYRNSDRAGLVLEDTLQRITDEQDEVPECPACREFMLEAGTQTIEAGQFKAAEPRVIGGPVLPAPFKVTWYVCPSCFHASSLLSSAYREPLLKRLAKPE